MSIKVDIRLGLGTPILNLLATTYKIELIWITCSFTHT